MDSIEIDDYQTKVSLKNWKPPNHPGSVYTTFSNAIFPFLPAEAAKKSKEKECVPNRLEFCYIFSNKYKII